MSRFAAYHAAIAADNAYEAAIKRQFGPNATRWDYPSIAYNDATRAAFVAKRAADEANLAALRARPEEPVDCEWEIV